MAYDLGDTVPLGIDVLDADGDPTAALTAVLTVDQPDGTAVTPTVTNPSVGRYEVDYVPAQAGRHGVRWVSTGPAAAFSDAFDVRPGAPRYLISLADAKRHLNITSSAHDEELRGHIEAATATIEQYLHEVVVRRTAVQKVGLRRRASQVALDHYPVVSLTSVESLDGATTWDVADLDVDDVGILTVQAGSALSGTVVVTYVAGRSVIPPNYARAAELVVECLYEAQRDAGAGPPARPGGEDELAPDPYGVVMSPKVRELLGVTGPMVG